jgi:alginate O-acetyltransferase complex protein AlgI
MMLCGLWHGPHWNFAAWGVYHGIGLASGPLVRRALSLSGIALPKRLPLPAVLATVLGVMSWAGTLVFVCLGWLVFFYPVDHAATMALQLFVR